MTGDQAFQKTILSLIQRYVIVPKAITTADDRTFLDVINTLHSLDPEKSEVYDFALNPKDTSSFFTVGSDQCLLKLSVGKKD